MPLQSTAAQNGLLASYFGANKAAGAPAAFELALLNAAGVELDLAGGYARVSMPNDGTNFPAPDDGQIVCAVQTWTPTDQWTVAGNPDTATQWRLYNSTTGDPVIGESLSAEISVEQAGGTVTAQPTIFFGGQTEDDA